MAAANPEIGPYTYNRADDGELVPIYFGTSPEIQEANLISIDLLRKRAPLLSPDAVRPPELEDETN